MNFALSRPTLHRPADFYALLKRTADEAAKIIQKAPPRSRHKLPKWLRAVFESHRDEDDEIRWYWKAVEDTRVAAAIRDAKSAEELIKKY